MFPESVPEREKWIEEQVLACHFEAKWCEIVHNVSGREIRLSVMEDALKIDGVRVNVSARLSQKLADIFDASLPTPMVADMMFSSAIRKASPCPQPISSTVNSMKKHSDAVDKQIGQGFGLASTVGKHWVLDKKLESKNNLACNYGWHFAGQSFQGISGSPAVSQTICPGVRVIQPNATAHDFMHSDYSQICQLVNQTCWIDGVERRFSDVLKHPTDSQLISHQGPLRIDRQPGTIPTVGQYVMFPVVVDN